MACACNSNKSTGGAASKSYTVKFADGSTKAYRTEIEAKAVSARNAGSSVKVGS